MNTILNDTTYAQASDTTVAQPPRLDLYAPIHKALRHNMHDSLLRVGRLDTADAGEMAQTLSQLDELLQLCAQHVMHENQFMHPAIEARAAEATDRVAGEHDEHLQSIQALCGEAQRLRGADVHARPALAHRLYKHLALFVAENLQHMHYEETVHNALLWAHYSDDELLALHDRLIASVPFDEMLTTARWMLPALSPMERTGMLGGMQQGMPPVAFGAVLDAMRPQLDERAWGKLSAALGLAASA